MCNSDVLNRPKYVRNRQFLVIQKDFRPIEEDTNVLLELINDDSLSKTEKLSRVLEVPASTVKLKLWIKIWQVQIRIYGLDFDFLIR